jgi:nitroreductase
MMGDRATMDGLEALLAARHSCRAFRADPVPDPVIERIANAAQRTASWNNVQPWQLIVTRGDATDAFRTMMLAAVERDGHNADIPFPDAYLGKYKERRSACGWQLYGAVGIERGDRAASARQMLRNFELFDAPHVMIVTSPRELGTYGVLDCGAFVATFMLAAEAMGVATIAQAAIASYSGQVRAHFAIPEDRIIVCAVSFGYEESDHVANSYRTPRAGLDEVIDWR